MRENSVCDNNEFVVLLKMSRYTYKRKFAKSNFGMRVFSFQPLSFTHNPLMCFHKNLLHEDYLLI